jgi:SAM-dependent methyltransferase
MRLPESVRSGLPIDHGVPDSPDWRKRFTWAMHHRALEMAPAIAAQVPLGGAKTFLDLGGGPGTYAMAFLAKHPRLRAAVCDREAALNVAKEIAVTHRAGRRLSYVPLDFAREPIPGTYDVIWYSNVLHIYSPEDNRAIFRRALSALTPGGRFIIQDALLHDREGLFPAEASLFAVSMLLFTEGGNTYSASETAAWLRESGFSRRPPAEHEQEEVQHPADAAAQQRTDRLRVVRQNVDRCRQIQRQAYRPIDHTGHRRPTKPSPDQQA